MAARSVARAYRTLVGVQLAPALEIDSALPGPPQGRGRRYQPALQKGAGPYEEAYRRISLRGLIGCAQNFTPKPRSAMRCILRGQSADSGMVPFAPLADVGLIPLVRPEEVEQYGTLLACLGKRNAALAAARF
jgi:hypothetical protein